jgi:hypothetical protein
MNANIKLEAYRGYTRWACDVCGETQEKDGMLSTVEPDGIDICRACLEAGPEGAIERAAKQAERLQEYVNSLRVDYPVLLRSVTEWKTGKDYDAVINAREKQIREGWADEIVAGLSDEAPF